jgi:hypothetical protein
MEINKRYVVTILTATYYLNVLSEEEDYINCDVSYFWKPDKFERCTVLKAAINVISELGEVS